MAREIRANSYDVVYNLHGGTTATLLTRATGARHRVGYQTYQYARLHNHLVAFVGIALGTRQNAFGRATTGAARLDGRSR